MPRLTLLEHDDEVMFCGDFAAARLKSAGALTESYMGMAPVPCGAGAGEIAAGAVAPGADEAAAAGCCTRPVRMGVRSAPGAGQRLPGLCPSPRLPSHRLSRTPTKALPNAK